MMFHSVQFLALVAATFAAFWLVSHRTKWPRLIVLFVASIVFYAAWNPAPLVIFFAYCLVNWAGGQALDRMADGPARKAVLIAALCFHLGILILYKYLDLFLGSLGTLATALELQWKPQPIGMLLPIGLSFVAFQAI